MQENLFEIKITPESRLVLMRIKKWAVFFYICTIATCILDSISAALLFKNYRKFFQDYTSTIRFQIVTDIIGLFTYGLLLVLGGYFFYQFCRRSTMAFENESSEDFNESFKFLLRHVTIASFLFAINSIWAIVVVYNQVARR